MLELLEVLGALGVAQGRAGQDLRRGVVELALADQLGVRRARVLQDLVQLGLDETPQAPDSLLELIHRPELQQG
ncbi:hypothetical protein, partial [Stenotrophomonas maltophilia]|uniref:hypothetical protein n=1 Tax=Stenotrophomonas maltophilia TaxID=40324 RepID=UPI002811C17C